MPKTITSPVECFPGTVTLYDPLNYPQLLVVTQNREELAEQDIKGVEWNYLWLTAIFEVVEKWDLDNFPKDVTAETFPSTPLGDSDALIIWLSREINSLIVGAEEVPNE